MSLDNPRPGYAIYRVESYETADTAGLHGPHHVRPMAGQGLATTMRVECPKTMRPPHYTVGTQFEIEAKVTRGEGGIEFLWSHASWPYRVIGLKKGKRQPDDS